jgi:hypothetical protein
VRGETTHRPWLQTETVFFGLPITYDITSGISIYLYTLVTNSFHQTPIIISSIQVRRMNDYDLWVGVQVHTAYNLALCVCLKPHHDTGEIMLHVQDPRIQRCASHIYIAPKFWDYPASINSTQIRRGEQPLPSPLIILLGLLSILGSSIPSSIFYHHAIPLSTHTLSPFDSDACSRESPHP